ncbi:MAG: hypothetical protein GWN55_04415 [Phycisphaerae bacterium]|nr:hypothetical protein [Phycisphaerae bacterium]NIR63641.1 hypothetical protein [candidate division Zixibacteria bacterium]NIP56412.1 hypothetical protein [Phycisphaerae bacterium]NIS54863.1 hypothetical protein [Phycisphaerae bacterium]NIU13729.1 hypothetical protein [candidate division Zixibacteria bacterium]
MKAKSILSISVVLLFAVATETLAGPMGTVFTYQGRLYDAGEPAEGIYDFQFSLYDEPNDGQGNLIRTITKEQVNVANGYFTVKLDFGDGIFTGDSLWLEISVRPGSGNFTTLGQRQEVTSAPYAIRSESTKKAEQLVLNFVVHPNESVSAGDVIALVDDKIKKGAYDLSVGDEYIFNAGNVVYPSASMLSGTKFMIAYAVSSQGVALISDSSETALAFGPECIFSNTAVKYISSAALSETKIVVAYEDYINSQYGTVVIGDVNGNSITFGTKYVFNNAETRDISVTALSVNKLVIAYQDVGNSNYGTAIICEVDGNSINFGPEYVFSEMYNNQGYSVVSLSETKFVVAYNYGYGAMVIGQVDGNSISFGPETIFQESTADYISTTVLSETKLVVAFGAGGIVGIVDGDFISFGPKFVFDSSASYISASAISDKKFVVTYRDEDNSDYGTAIIGDVDGNSISYGQEYVFNDSSTIMSTRATAALSATKFCTAYEGSGCVVAFSLGGVPLGIAGAHASSGESVPVIIKGLSEHHSGLVLGSLYYANPDGSLTRTQTNTRVGMAISSNKLLIDVALTPSITPPITPP